MELWSGYNVRVICWKYYLICVFKFYLLKNSFIPLTHGRLRRNLRKRTGMSTVSLKSSSKSDKSHIEIILSLSAFSVRAWFGIRLTRHTVKSSVANGNSPDKLRHTRSVRRELNNFSRPRASEQSLMTHPTLHRRSRPRVCCFQMQNQPAHGFKSVEIETSEFFLGHPVPDPPWFRRRMCVIHIHDTKMTTPL